MKAILYYIHDPMCSWCWGFSRTLNELLESLPKDVEVCRLLGGLAPDSDIAMPESMQESIKSNWSRIEDKILGVKFNYDFWTNTIPRRSTYPACRAVLAARQQGEKYDVLMTKAIQRAYYLEARNPSDNSTLIELAKELDLLVSEFERDLVSDKIQEALVKEIAYARKIYADSYPNLVLVVADECFTVRIDYNDSETMLEEIKNHL